MMEAQNAIKENQREFKGTQGHAVNVTLLQT